MSTYAWIRVRVVYNATFHNILVISWRSVLLVEETGIHREYHRPDASQWQTLSHNVVSSTPCLCGVRAHNFSGDRHTTCSVHPQLSTPVAVSSRCHCSPNSLHQWQSKVVVTVHPTLHTSGSQQSLSLFTQLSTPVAVSSRCHCSPNSTHQWQSAVVVTVHPTLHQRLLTATGVESWVNSDNDCWLPLVWRVGDGQNMLYSVVATRGILFVRNPENRNVFVGAYKTTL
jgi:hypothetical protein